MRKLRVTVDGKAYEVVVEELDAGGSAQPAPAMAAASASVGSSVSAPAAAAPSATASGGPGDVPSPLAGRVVTINVAVGDAVEEGATLVTLEAMKMNTFVTAPVAGTVKAILIKEGDGVEEGQPLVTVQ
jgi:glutaconyl-CoA/methylmalonyl-CoA decarboxylase subunit gamma